MIGRHARAWGRRIDRFEGRAFTQPLLQQQGRSSTVEATAAIACQAMAFSSRPGAAVLIHPGQRKLQCSGQAMAVTTAMNRLSRRSPSSIEGQSNDKPLHGATCAMALQDQQIRFEATAMQGGQRRHRDAQWIASGQTDSTAADVKTEHGAGSLQGRQRRPRLGVGRGA